jgi:hypothetical protein
MSEGIFCKSYPISDAERGKFVVLDPTTLPGYCSADAAGFTARGRYALLTYLMGQAGTLSAVITEPVALQGVISADLIQIENVNVSSLISAACYNPLDLGLPAQIRPIYVTVSGIEDPITVSTIQNVVTAKLIDTVINVSSEPIEYIQTIVNPVTTVALLGNTTQVMSQTIANGDSAIITFTPPVEFVELLNMTPNKDVYFGYDTGVSFAALTSTGLLIAGEAYYSIERTISDLVIGNPTDTNVDLRVYGHYRS